MNYTSVIPTLKQEGFTVKTCPQGKTSYITDDGITNCCSGEVINNHCENVFCSLSPGEPNNCSSVLINRAQQRSNEKCPPSISGDCNNYYSDTKGIVKGCSKSGLTSDLTGPSDLSLPYCRFYDTVEDNTRNYDSCQNYLVRYSAVAGLATCKANAKLAATSSDLVTCKANANLAAP